MTPILAPSPQATPAAPSSPPPPRPGYAALFLALYQEEIALRGVADVLEASRP